MLRLSTFCLLLALTQAQNGYEYNRPNRPFAPGSSSSRPGTSPGNSFSTTTSYPLRPQNDDFGPGGPTTGYPTGPQNYPGTSSQRPGNQGSTYPQGQSGSGYPGQDNSYPGSNGPNGYPGGSRYPGSDNRYPGQEQNYPGQPGFGSDRYEDDGHYEGGDYSAIPGEPDIDYPVLSYIPQTSFNCQLQRYPGYYSDVETRCQVFHVCSNNRTYDFLCPNGTIFSQEDFICVWWNQFTCESAPGLYELNTKIYDYSRTSDSYPNNKFNDYPGTFGNRNPQAPTSQRPSSYPSSRPQGPSTPYPSGPASYQGSSTPYPSGPGSYPGTQGPAGSYPGSQGPSGSYPGSQGPTASQGPSGGYPGSDGASNFPGSYPTGPQGPPGSSGSGYPNSGQSSYPGSGPGTQGYPSGRPSGPSFRPGGNRGRPVQKPNREYLPPRN